jgi:hypothetical protein
MAARNHRRATDPTAAYVVFAFLSPRLGRGRSSQGSQGLSTINRLRSRCPPEAVLYADAHNHDLCASANKQNKYAIAYIDF